MADEAPQVNSFSIKEFFQRLSDGGKCCRRLMFDEGGFGDSRYLSRHPQSPTLPYIDRKHISRSGARQVHRVLHGIHALIGHDRDIYVVPDVRHPGHVYWWNRLLGKVNAELAHSPDRLDCHSRRPASVSVYAQPHLWTNSLANRPHAFVVVLIMASAEARWSRPRA